MIYSALKSGKSESLLGSLIDELNSLYGADSYAPNFEEVEGAYWFGPVRLSIGPSVRYAFCWL